MKKIIIAILLFIPIIVLLTITASGMLIVSAFVEIPAESILIKHSGQEVKNEEIILEEQDPVRKYTLFCEMFPGIATDEMEWASSDPSVAKVTPSESRKDAAEVEFFDYGRVDITCTSKKNTSVTARAAFYVSGHVPGYLLIGDYDVNDLDALTMRIYEVKPLLAQVVPAASAREAKTQWRSLNEDIVKVDNNGVVTALSAGTAVIEAKVESEQEGIDPVSKQITITVSAEANIFNQKTVYTTNNVFDFDEMDVLTDTDVTLSCDVGATMIGSYEVDLTAVSDFGSVVVTARKGDYSEELVLVKVPSTSALVIENLYSLKAGALSSYMALGTSNIELSVIALDEGTPTVRWVSSDPSVVNVVNGRLYATGSGSAEIYAEADGYVSEHVTVNVTDTVEDFRLSEEDYMDKRGLMQERVFGNVTYKDGTYTRTYPLTVESFSSNAGIESYTFESTNEAIAKVDRMGVITFAEDVEGESVTITATAYNQAGLPVRRTYTFHLVNGVNVGVGVKRTYVDTSTGEKPNFAPYWDLVAVAANRDVQAIVLHTDVYYPSRADGGKPISNLTASLYGNGNKLDGQLFMKSVEDDEMLLLWDFDTFSDMPENIDIRITNLNLQATHPTTEDSRETFEELNRTGGGAISLKGNYPVALNTMKLTVKGCLFQYAYSHMNVAIGDVVVDGCILRNNAASAIVLQQSSYCTAKLKLKNCIFSHTIAPVTIACGNFDEILARNKGQDTGSIQFGSFELEGQMYVYNWKKLEEVQMNILPQNLEDADSNALVSAGNSVLASVIREAFMRSSPQTLYTDEEGTQWLNFSFLMLGIWADMNPQFNGKSTKEGNTNGIDVHFTEGNFECVEVMAHKVKSLRTINTLLKFINLKEYRTYHIYSKDSKGTWNTKPGENYEINDTIRARLRGEGA